jgi:hypothetical protein
MKRWSVWVQDLNDEWRTDPYRFEAITEAETAAHRLFETSKFRAVRIENQHERSVYHIGELPDYPRAEYPRRLPAKGEER